MVVVVDREWRDGEEGLDRDRDGREGKKKQAWRHAACNTFQTLQHLWPSFLPWPSMPGCLCLLPACLPCMPIASYSHSVYHCMWPASPSLVTYSLPAEKLLCIICLVKGGNDKNMPIPHPIVEKACLPLSLSSLPLFKKRKTAENVVFDSTGACLHV